MLDIPSEIALNIVNISQEYNLFLTCKEFYFISTNYLFSMEDIINLAETKKIKLIVEPMRYINKFLKSGINATFIISYDNFLISDSLHFSLNSNKILFTRVSKPENNHNLFIMKSSKNSKDSKDTIIKLKKTHIIIKPPESKQILCLVHKPFYI